METISSFDQRFLQADFGFRQLQLDEEAFRSSRLINIRTDFRNKQPVISGDEWDYNNHGVDWKGMCKSTRQQSPIDLPSEDMWSYSASRLSIFFKYPPLTRALQLANDGKSISVRFKTCIS